MIAIIAEKPSVGQDIARVLGVTTKKDGFLEGNGYMVTWAYGHLLNLALPEDYGIDSYNKENLPIIPDPFKLLPRKIRTKKGYQVDGTAKKQLNVIKTVFSKCDSIIVATDAGREGELIFRHIYNYLNCKKPFTRLWISSLTDSAIKNGIANLKDGKEYDSLYLAAEARSKADWLLGINASRALCLCSGEGNNSLGRVQTPTLALICKRYLEHTHFKPETYWQALMNVKKDDIVFQVKGVESYFKKEEAGSLYKNLKTYPLAKVSKVESKEVTQEPPLLHDLTSLQKEANNRFGFSADKTLKIAQSLYEKKLITYPRTGSRYIPDDVFVDIPTLITRLKSYPIFADYAVLLSVMKLNKRSVNKKKVTDHHALLITDQKAVKMVPDEMAIYEMIAGRMLEAFSIPCIKDVTHVEVCCDDIVFKTSGAVIKQQGWKDVLRQDDPEDEKEDNQPLPVLNEDDYLNIESYNLVQKSTKPKPLYTEASLLTAMETAGKNIEDEEARKAMKECGIGTPATRASIIETLFNREYIERNKKTLIPTKKGLELYKSVKEMRIADVETTGLWEKAMLKIEKEPGYYDTFLQGLHIHVKQVSDEIISVIEVQNMALEAKYICPKCKLGKVTIFSKLAKCNYSKCRFTLYRNILGKTLTDNQTTELIKTGRSPLIKGFIGKSGKAFDAYIVIEEGKAKFEFPDNKENKNL